MENIKFISKHVQQRRSDGGNGFWCLFGEILKDEKGEYFYKEEAKENPRVVNINDLPNEVRKSILQELSLQ